MPPRNERKVAEFTGGIALARLGPILVKYLQNLSAMFMGSVIVLPSNLNDEGRDGLFLRLFITSFSRNSDEKEVVEVDNSRCW